MTVRRQPDSADLLALAERFRIGAAATDAAELTAGHINDSYVIGTASGDRFLMQRINDHVFPQPRRVMENVERVTSHIADKLGPTSGRRRLTLIPAANGRSWTEVAAPGAARGCWRMYELIEGATSELGASSPQQVFRAARAFGAFQGLVADLPPPSLFETIPRFHDTVSRFADLDAALHLAPGDACLGRRRRCADAEIRAAAEHRGLAGRLLDAAARGLPLRTVHNDCKISNVLFDRQSGEALCVVDLDTVMPGMAAFDFGDMARSMAHRQDEDARDPENVEVDLELFEALASGYLDGARFLTSDERDSLVDGALVLTLEQAVRFLTDHLLGDVYFRVERPLHNLERSRVQFALLESMVRRQSDLRRIVGRS